MRTLTLLASGVLAGISAAGPAGAQPSVWQGNLFITSVTQACTASGAAAAGDYFTAVYRPSIPPPGEEFMGIYGGNAAWLLRDLTLRGKQAPDTHLISSEAELRSASTMVVLRITPRTITSTTRVVEISGTIDNFFENFGCVVGVTGALGSRP